MTWLGELEGLVTGPGETTGVVILTGPQTLKQAYVDYQAPCCPIGDAVVEGLRGYFDIVAFYSPTREARSVKFFKGLREFQRLRDGGAEDEPPVQVGGVSSYLESIVGDYDIAWQEGRNAGRKDAETPGAELYRDDPRRIVKDLDQFVFGQDQLRALVVFDDWTACWREVLCDNQGGFFAVNEEQLQRFRRWTATDALPRRRHLFAIVSERSPMRVERGDGDQVELRLREAFSPEYCREVVVTSPTALDIARSVLASKYRGELQVEDGDVEVIGEMVLELVRGKSLRQFLTQLRDISQRTGEALRTDTVARALSLVVPKRPLEQWKWPDLLAALSGGVVGQEAALEIIARRLVTAARSKGRRKGPLAKFILVGPAATGKTETAKVLSDVLFGEGPVTFPANQARGEEGLWLAYGPPNGYVGWTEEKGQNGGGQLTRPFLANPERRRVLLIDEIDKAEGQLQESLYQLLDEGRAQDRSAGRWADFSNAIVICTSNRAQDEIRALMQRNPPLQEAQREARDILQRAGDPAPFLSRFTGIIPFCYPAKAALQIVTRNRINMLATMEGRSVTSVDPAYVESVLERNRGLPAGIRGIIETVTQDLEDQFQEAPPGVPLAVDGRGQVVESPG